MISCARRLRPRRSFELIENDNRCKRDDRSKRKKGKKGEKNGKKKTTKCRIQQIKRRAHHSS